MGTQAEPQQELLVQQLFLAVLVQLLVQNYTMERLGHLLTVWEMQDIMEQVAELKEQH